MCKHSRILLMVLITTLISSCATNKANNPPDPYESFNRKVFAFNMALDKVLFRPVAKTYDYILPNPAKKGISNAFDNVNEIPTVVNDLLQAEPGWAIADAWRFFFNSTIGVFGLFDVASHFGLKRRVQDLGLTFAKWGAKQSPYFVIPILGPSTVRDGVALLANYELFTIYPHINPWTLRWGLLGLYFIDVKADLLPTNKLVDEAIDPYVFVRDAYLQRRAHLINGNKEDEDTYVEAEQPKTSS